MWPATTKLNDIPTCGTNKKKQDNLPNYLQKKILLRKNVCIFAMPDSKEIYTIVVTSTVYIFKHLFKLSRLFDNIYF